MANFDLINKKNLKNATRFDSTTSEKKVANSFMEGGHVTPMVMPRPHPCGSK